ncbi:hypothetical protein SRIMM317S_03802 [Streptomyces rimosus subsp. rimosus]
MSRGPRRPTLPALTPRSRTLSSGPSVTACAMPDGPLSASLSVSTVMYVPVAPTAAPAPGTVPAVCAAETGKPGPSLRTNSSATSR